MRITLRVDGLGHVPSFKNSKMMASGRPITKPEYQEWMDRCIRSFESQLRYGEVTTGDGTSTGQWPPSWIAWSGQFDDSRQWIPKQSVEWRTVAKGSEGAIVTIEPLS